MRLILGDNSFFGVNHSKSTTLDLNANFNEYAETIDDAYELLELHEMMISPHPNYLKLLSRVTKPVALTILIPMPQTLNKEIATNGWTRSILRYAGRLALALTNINFVTSVLNRTLRNFSFKYFIFYCFISIEIQKVVKETRHLAPKITAVGLHNLMTDLLIAGDNSVALQAFVDATSDARMKTVFVTQNIPPLCRVLAKLNTNRKVAVCGSFNQLGYMSNPSLRSINDTVTEYRDLFEFWAMQILCSGSINVVELDAQIFSNFDAVLIASRKVDRLKQLSEKLIDQQELNPKVPVHEG